MRIRGIELVPVAVMLLSACAPASYTPTPPPTPITPLPLLPTVDQTQAIGVNNPTAAAMPNEAGLPGDVTPTQTKAPTMDVGELPTVTPPSPQATAFLPTVTPMGSTPVAVSVNAPDGLALQGVFYPPIGQTPAPGLLLLHMLGRQKEDWGELAARLQQLGYGVLAVDMRGHGATGGAVDWTAAEADVPVMLEFLRGLPGIDPERIGGIGASIGANLILRGCAADGGCRTVILLSPGLDYRGVTTEDAMIQLGMVPIMFAASSEDEYAASSSTRLDSLAIGDHNLIMYDGAGHGTNMLSAGVGLADRIVEWLARYLPTD